MRNIERRVVTMLAMVVAVSCMAEELPSEEYAHIKSSGRYVMLADSENQLGNGEEVEIATDFYIARRAVTCEQWHTFIQATGRAAPRYWLDGQVPEGKERHPVVWVSAEEAAAYCQWLGQRYPDFTFRLPTQGEWEYAACGEGRTVFPWGGQSEVTYTDGILSSKFNFNAVVGAAILETPDRLATYNNPKSTRYGEQDRVADIFSISSNGSVKGWIDHSNYLGFVYTDIFAQINEGGGYTCAVDDYPEGASWAGCYNMSGNCWEWTSTLETATNGAERGQQVNVIKGGSWYATMSSCRISYRGEGRKGSGRYATVGIRVVAEQKTASSIFHCKADAEPPLSDTYTIQGIRQGSHVHGLQIRKHSRIYIRR